jgi:CubicO group peptidase (beta-lactamase class C family)
MRLLVLVPLALLIACPSDELADDDDAAPEYEPLPSAIASVFEDEADDLGASGAAIAIHFNGRLYAGTFGTKDPDGGAAVAPSTLFRIGSTTKMMTATAVLAAVDRGDMALSDSVVDHLPGLEFRADGAAPLADVTLHHLLSHTSGISEITPIDGGEADARLYDFTYSGFRSTSYMMAPPGAFWNYSNPNFSLAGAAVEATDGRSYRDLMAEDVWGPLGMDRSMFLGSEVEADGDFASADTYDWTGQSQDPVRVGADSYDDAWSRPAGFAWSSVLDMVRWGRFLMDGDASVIDDASHAELIGDQANMKAYLDYGTYGYGVIRWAEAAFGGQWFELTTLQHNGAIPGYAAEVITVPAHDFVLVTLAAGDGAYFGETTAKALAELLGAEAVAIPDPQIEADLSRYVGTYRDPHNVGTVNVSLADGALVWEMPRLDGLDIPYGRSLTPTSLGSFRTSIQGSATGVIFLTEDGSDEGPTRWLRHRAFVADRGDVGRSHGGSPHADEDRVRAFLRRLSTPTL